MKSQFPEFVSEKVAAKTIGISVKTLQHDRMLDQPRFPWYRASTKRVVYDKSELLQIVLSTRRGVPAA
jgi:hypothetical protein